MTTPEEARRATNQLVEHENKYAGGSKKMADHHQKMRERAK